jgi:hypothetical protein
MTAPTEDEAYAAGLEEIKALRERLRRLEEMAQAVAQPGVLTDRTPNFGDALDTLRRTGSASGPAIDSLRAAVEGPRTPPAAPDPERLREATQRVTSDLRGSASIEEAYSAMQERATRRNVVETASPGALGRVDPTNPATATAIDRLRKALSEEH